MAIKEKRELAREAIHVQPCIERGLLIADSVGERKRDLLHGCRSRLANMVTTDADCVPAWKVFSAVAENIGNDAHRVLRRIDIRSACDVLFQDVVLHGPGQFAY